MPVSRVVGLRHGLNGGSVGRWSRRMAPQLDEGLPLEKHIPGSAARNSAGKEQQARLGLTWWSYLRTKVSATVEGCQ